MSIKEIKNIRRFYAFNGNYAVFETRNSYCGIMDRKGNIICPADTWKWASHICDDIFLLETWDESGDDYRSVNKIHFDAKLNAEVAQPVLPSIPERELPEFAKRFEDAYWCADKRIAFRENELYGITDEKGVIIVSPAYYAIQSAKEYGYDTDRIMVLDTNCNNGYLDLDGTVVVPVIYPYVRYQQNLGIIRFRTQEFKWGYMDKNGKNVIPAIYDYVNAGETYGLNEVAVVKDGDCYFINSHGKKVNLW